jgi:carbamoyltransferase
LPKAFLGISAFYHDSAAALVVDGRVVAAAQQERFSRIRHDAGFPGDAVRYCLREAGIGLDEVEAVAYYEDPALKFRRVLAGYAAAAPRAFPAFARSLPEWLGWKRKAADTVRTRLEALGLGRAPELVVRRHHESHAASAFLPSPYRSAAVLCVDGVGEWATTTLWHGRGTGLEPIAEIRYPHSLGLLYSAFTYFCGFKVDSGEYKVMGLAPYGKPKYADVIRRELIDLRPDGSFRLNLRHFAYLRGEVMTGRSFERLFGGPRRTPEGPLTEREFDLAASVQRVTEEAMLNLARAARERTGESRLCLAGGVALNCVANGKIAEAGIFEELWIQPAAGDAGGALGAALALAVERGAGRAHLAAEAGSGAAEGVSGGAHPAAVGASGAGEGASGASSRPAAVRQRDAMSGALLGPAFTDDEIGAYLDSCGAVGKRLDPETLAREVAARLAQGKVVGWFQGRMEFGPRALGARSILGDPRNRDMQTTMNLKIKFRESFRPFAPVVLAEHARAYFDLDQPSPYMLLVAQLAAAQRLETPEAAGATGLELLKLCRSTLPAITHVDYSARVQTVTPQDAPDLHRVLTAFHAATGCPVLVNTSFNVRGEPIVHTPQDAYTCFMRTNIDVLALGGFLLDKTEQPQWREESDWREAIPLD